jgi:hypothetical protein
MQAHTQQSVRSWGLDRIDQTNLPLDGVYAPGDLDGSGSHLYVLVGVDREIMHVEGVSPYDTRNATPPHPAGHWCALDPPGLHQPCG